MSSLQELLDEEKKQHQVSITKYQSQIKELTKELQNYRLELQEVQAHLELYENSVIVSPAQLRRLTQVPNSMSALLNTEKNDANEKEKEEERDAQATKKGKKKKRIFLIIRDLVGIDNDDNDNDDDGNDDNDNNDDENGNNTSSEDEDKLKLDAHPDLEDLFLADEYSYKPTSADVVIQSKLQFINTSSDAMLQMRQLIVTLLQQNKQLQLHHLTTHLSNPK
ncbi:hypothetical protein RFI_26426 [Reticulomyxa filosa]|uniref:Uncharacterized protein n=1 Tax=Reticulomyxa filosa TaxID=46433 RepID=X6MBC5_RETFI|nr:hypothetical protein RFI_26426 [Reticulomyxa filosa]|eukprot:ETO10951.1 hypothetical protein RFI_26426 [Reticulomyxa filosa]